MSVMRSALEFEHLQFEIVLLLEFFVKRAELLRCPGHEHLKRLRLDRLRQYRKAGAGRLAFEKAARAAACGPSGRPDPDARPRLRLQPGFCDTPRIRVVRADAQMLEDPSQTPLHLRVDAV